MTYDLSHTQLLVLFLLTVQSLSIFGCKEYNQSDFGVVPSGDVHVQSLLLCCWKRVFAMTVHFLGKTLLVFALFHSAFQGQICLSLQVFLDFLLVHSSPL